MALSLPSPWLALAATASLALLACTAPPIEQPAPDAFLVATLQFES